MRQQGWWTDQEWHWQILNSTSSLRKTGKGRYEQIATLIDDPQDLKECIVESEELRDDIHNKIIHFKSYKELHKTNISTTSH